MSRMIERTPDEQERIRQLLSDPDRATASVMMLVRKYGLNRYLVTRLTHPERIVDNRVRKKSGKKMYHSIYDD